jgi:hypothetical protein
LCGHLTGKFNHCHGADLNAGLFSTGPSLFTPVRGIDAQVAFLGFHLFKIPDYPAGLIRAGCNTFLATDALGLVYRSDVAIGCINMIGACRASRNTGREDTLPALPYINVFSAR